MPLLAIKGMGSPDVERVYRRARELALEIGETPQLSSVLEGLWWFYEVRGDMAVARELAEELVALAQGQQAAVPLMQAHRAMGQTLFWVGDFAAAREHLEQVNAVYEPDKHRPMAFTHGHDPSVVSQAFTAHILWYLGFPDRALQAMNKAFALATDISHPFTLAVTLDHTAWLHQYRREEYLVRERAEADMELARAHGFPYFLAQGMILHGWSLAALGHIEEGITEIRDGLTAHRATGAGGDRPYWLLLLAEVCGMGGHVEEALEAVDEALADVSKSGVAFCEAELVRVKGAVLLQRSAANEAAAEKLFCEALQIARRQQTKSLELRAAVSLSRLWQHRGEREDALELLSDIYGWFTEGFDTADLEAARVLLNEAPK
jgi:predicted ATPase